MNNYIFRSPIGLLEIKEENEKIIGLDLLQNTFSMDIAKYAYHSDLIYEAYIQINEYFKGKRRKFNLPICCIGTAFQKLVWEELRNITYGETRSYKDVAIQIGNPKAARTVGQANNKNPIMIVIPCHRVIHQDGNVTGFGCGTEVKKYLLELERDN